MALSELTGVVWAGWSADTACHTWLVQTLRGQGAEPTIGYTVADYATQLDLVAAGLAAALVPRLSRDPVPAGVRLIATRPVLRKQVSAVWRTDADRRAIRAGIEALAEASPDL